MKIFKWIIGTLIGLYVLVNLAIVIFAGAYVGNNGTGKIKFYDFKIDSLELRKEINALKSELKIKDLKDSISYNETVFSFNIEDKEASEDINYTLSYYTSVNYNSDIHTSIYLIYINEKRNKDFSWFSLEKYRAIKLLEKTVIKPLSEKYKKHG